MESGNKAMTTEFIKMVEAFTEQVSKISDSITELGAKAESMAKAMNRLAEALEEHQKPFGVFHLDMEKRKKQILKDFDQIGLKTKRKRMRRLKIVY